MENSGEELQLEIPAEAQLVGIDLDSLILGGTTEQDFRVHGRRDGPRLVAEQIELVGK